MRVLFGKDAVVRELERAGFLDAEEEADELMGSAPDATVLVSWLTRRTKGEPLAWITGSTSFCGRRVLVDPGVFVPRPQSEELALRAGIALAASSTRRALDLCTGSGAVACHLLATVPNSHVVGADRDPLAVRCAQRNGVATVRADLGSCFRPRLFDVITAIAPYVPTHEIAFLPSDVQRYEPPHCLDGGADGLDLVRRILEQSSRLLGPGGMLFVELGGNQDQAITPLLERFGLCLSDRWVDDDGDLRGLSAKLLPRRATR